MDIVFLQLLPPMAFTKQGLQKIKGEPVYRVDLIQLHKMVLYRITLFYNIIANPDAFFPFETVTCRKYNGLT